MRGKDIKKDNGQHSSSSLRCDRFKEQGNWVKNDQIKLVILLSSTEYLNRLLYPLLSLKTYRNVEDVSSCDKLFKQLFIDNLNVMVFEFRAQGLADLA